MRHSRGMVPTVWKTNIMASIDTQDLLLRSGNEEIYGEATQGGI